MIYFEKKKLELLTPIVNVRIGVFDSKTKKLLNVIEDHNLVTTAGKNLIRDLLAITAGVTGLNYFAIGTGTTAAAATDTQLGTEVHRDVFTNSTKTSNNLNIQYYLDSSTGNGSTLTEAGLFGDDASGVANSGTLFARVVHSGIAKTASVAITYSWDISFN